MKLNEKVENLLSDYSRIEANIDQNTEDNPNKKTFFDYKYNQLNLGFIGRCNRPMRTPQQFTGGVWGNTCGVSLLNSTKKFSVSESSFNSDDPRFKSMSHKAKRFVADYKTSVAPDMKPSEGNVKVILFFRMSCTLYLQVFHKVDCMAL